MTRAAELIPLFDEPVTEAGSTDSAVLDRIRPLLADITAAAAAGERNRCLVPEIVDRLRDAGLYRMMIPRELGGEGLSMAQGCELIEQLAMADGAAGWTGMIAYGHQVTLSRMSHEQVGAVLGKGPDVSMRGAIAPTGKAVEVEGGYVISGRWSFGSGPFDPDWLIGGCVLLRDGVPVVGPEGQPEAIVVLMPRDDVQFFDNWDVVGLSGTNSCDYAAEDLFVPARRASPLGNWFAAEVPSTVDAPVFRVSFVLTTAPTHSAVVIGLARSAFEELTTVAKTKRRAHSVLGLADDPVFHDKLGGISSRLAALRALQETMVAEATDLIDSGATPPADLLPRVRSWVAHIHLECVQLINDCFTLAGTTPVYRTSRIQRQWRDARTAAQHYVASPVAFREFGKLLVQA